MNAEIFIARDSKSALEKVRAKLGPDALILSTARSDSGVDVSAITGDSSKAKIGGYTKSPSGDAVNDITLGYLDRELRALREIIYNALGERAWQEVAGKTPVRSAIDQRLHTLGLSKPAIEVVTANIDVSAGLNDSWAAVLSNLNSAIEVATDATIAINPRPQAVIGGSSSCRSLVCQQLIAKALQDLKPSKILVISVTKDPSGALTDFCKREKVKRFQVGSSAEAQRCLKRWGRQKKIFIETADLSPSLGFNDPTIELMKDRSLGIEVISVLPAIHQSETLRSIDLHIKGLSISGAIISLVAEAASLGAVLDALILSGTPLIGMSRKSDTLIEPLTQNGLIKVAKQLAKDRMDERKFASVLHTHSLSA